MPRTLTQIRDAAISKGVYTPVTALQAEVTRAQTAETALASDLAALSSINMFNALPGSPFATMADLEAAYTSDAAIASSVEIVIVGNQVYYITDITEPNATSVVGWSSKGLRKFLEFNDLAGLTSNLNSLQATVTGMNSSINTQITNVQTAITSEVTRAQTAETALADAIASEHIRSATAEANIISDISVIKDTLDTIVPVS